MASIVDTSVKHFYSAMAGAPAINGTAGSLIAALDAFLVTGWGSKAVDSASISNGVCRLNFASGKSAAEIHAVISVTGASPSALNGEQRVAAVANGWVEFKTTLPDGAVSGSISFKMAPLGWEKVFSKTNVAVYRQSDPASMRAFYRVDDTNALFARVQMYESMTDVDTGLSVAPALPSGGFYWHKRSAAAATGVYWALAGDGRGLTIAIAPYESSAASTSNGYGLYVHYAGDAASYRNGDAWRGVLTGAPSAVYTDVAGCVFCAPGTAGMVTQRGSTGLGGSVACSRAVLGAASVVSGADASLGGFPSRSDNGLRLSPILISDGPMSVNGPRGELPGVFHCPQSGVVGSYGGNVRFERGQADLSGKVLMTIPVGVLAGAATGVGFIDITDSWRA